jgi:hypothetical protein
MPNHVTNVIELKTEDFDRIKDRIMSGEEFDFEKLIPMPLNVYRGNISFINEIRFPNNWYNWSIENWGTKWNAYDTHVNRGEKETKLTFFTAWEKPDPVIVAFANLTKIPFQHKYFDEGHGFYGHDAWGFPRNNWEGKAMSLLASDYGRQDIYNSLCQELQGYHPDPPDMTGTVSDGDDDCALFTIHINDEVDPDD